MMGNNNITPPGLEPIFIGTKPGDESANGLIKQGNRY